MGEVYLKSNICPKFAEEPVFRVHYTEQQIEIVKKGLKRIANVILSNKRPFIARLDSEGGVKIWINHKGEDLIAKKQEKRRVKRQKPDE